ncbi:glycoside hydrolase family 28 protein [Sphingobacterium lactis]|uniref:glycoside hydrolase family 28 protein n=1 Tax=Sphingobacterium lactis TaxID=797291 RepID=UPI003DA398B0
MIKKDLLSFLGISLLCVLGNSKTLGQEPARPTIQQVSFPKDTTHIASFGAQGDGQFLNTEAINSAIAECNKKGGGVVHIPAGLWLTGPIELKSNVNLHVGRDAVLLFTSDFNEYKLVESNWEGEPSWRNQSPISGRNLENIGITGKGIIDGNGAAWRMVKKSKLTESQWKKLIESGGVLDEKQEIWYPSIGSLKGSKQKKPGLMKPGTQASDFQEVKDFLRPNLLQLTNCKKILLEGVTIQNSPAWNLHPLMCEDLTLRDLLVLNPWYAQNGDGVDVESCRNVLIEDCTFDVGDDGICIKSGRDKAGRDRGMPTENVIIRNNIVYHAHGGFVIGSEMSGGARNIWVEDCSFIGTDIGLRFKTTRGRGGVVENIFIKNINMFDIPGEAILFDMYYMAVDPVPLAGEKKETVKVVKLPVTEETPSFKNFTIENVHVHGADKGIFLRGLPEMNIQNISITNVNIQAKKGIDIIESSGITLNKIRLKTEESNPLLYVHNGKDIHINGLSSVNPVEKLIQVSGEESVNIKIQGNEIKQLNKQKEFINNASESALTIQ